MSEIKIGATFLTDGGTCSTTLHNQQDNSSLGKLRRALKPVLAAYRETQPTTSTETKRSKVRFNFKKEPAPTGVDEDEAIPVSSSASGFTDPSEPPESAKSQTTNDKQTINTVVAERDSLEKDQKVGYFIRNLGGLLLFASGLAIGVAMAGSTDWFSTLPHFNKSWITISTIAGMGGVIGGLTLYRLGHDRVQEDKEQAKKVVDEHVIRSTLGKLTQNRKAQLLEQYNKVKENHNIVRNYTIVKSNPSVDKADKIKVYKDPSTNAIFVKCIKEGKFTVFYVHETTSELKLIKEGNLKPKSS